METMTLRPATERDAADILSIYTPYIKETAITFECETPSLDEFMNRIRTISADYPYLVCQMGGALIGYAYAHRFRERAAYQWGAELSVYVRRDRQGCGAGRALYTALIGLLERQNVCTVYGCVTLPNERSERLHKALGFRQAGEFRRAGYKCGTWHDVAWFEKQIAPYPAVPRPFASIRTLGVQPVGAAEEEHGLLDVQPQ